MNPREGDRVVVTNELSEYHGQTGTVVRAYNSDWPALPGNVEVRLNEHHHHAVLLFANDEVAQTEETIQTYTIQVIEESPNNRDGFIRQHKRVLADLPAMMEAAEEDLSDLLPDGFRVVIKQWNEEE